jgi:hypothetical protein
MTPVEPTEAQIDAALLILDTEIEMPRARASDYVSPHSQDAKWIQELTAFTKADEEIRTQNREIVRRALRSASAVNLKR